MRLAISGIADLAPAGVVQVAEGVEARPLHVARQARRVGQVQHRLAPGAEVDAGVVRAAGSRRSRASCRRWCRGRR